MLLLFIYYWLYFLIPAVTTQIFNPIAELVISIGIPTKEAKAEIEMHPVIEEVTVSGQYNSKLYKLFYAFYSLIYSDLFLQLNNFLFNLFFSV